MQTFPNGLAVVGYPKLAVYSAYVASYGVQGDEHNVSTLDISPAQPDVLQEFKFAGCEHDIMGYRFHHRCASEFK